MGRADQISRRCHWEIESITKLDRWVSVCHLPINVITEGMKVLHCDIPKYQHEQVIELQRTRQLYR